MQRVLTAICAFAVLGAACGGGDAPRSAEPSSAPTTGEVPSVIFAPSFEAAVDLTPADLEAARAALEARLGDFGFADARVSIAGNNLEVYGAAIDSAMAVTLSRAGHLMFWQPIIDEQGFIGVLVGDVRYEPLTCNPQRDASGAILATIGLDSNVPVEFAPWEPETFLSPQVDIVWQPFTAQVDGRELTLTSELVGRTEVLSDGPGTETYSLVISLTPEGSAIASAVTSRLAIGQYPMALFMDGAPIRGASGASITLSVVAEVSDSGVITGLSKRDADSLSAVLATTPLPFALRVVE
jgi:hypothetical protein